MLRVCASSISEEELRHGVETSCHCLIFALAISRHSKRKPTYARFCTLSVFRLHHFCVEDVSGESRMQGLDVFAPRNICSHGPCSGGSYSCSPHSSLQESRWDGSKWNCSQTLRPERQKTFVNFAREKRRMPLDVRKATKAVDFIEWSAHSNHLR